MRVISCICAFSIALAIGVGLACKPASAECRAPHYVIGQDYGSSVFLSVSPGDLTTDNLVCLGQTLRKRRHIDTSFAVFVFKTHVAAQNYRGLGESHDPKWDRSLVADYIYDQKKTPIEVIDISPMGFEPAPYKWLNFALPLTQPLDCHPTAIQGRCLLAVPDSADYPQQALQENAAGSVILEATIQPDGRVADSHVAETDVAPSNQRDTLARAAIHDLEQWKFDSGPEGTPIRITYRYVVDPYASQPIAPAVQWNLPGEVVVRAHR